MYKLSGISSFWAQNIGWIGLQGPFYGEVSHFRFGVKKPPESFQGYFEVLNVSFWQKKQLDQNFSSFAWIPFQRRKNRLNRSPYEEVMPPASCPTQFTTMVPRGFHAISRFSHMRS